MEDSSFDSLPDEAMLAIFHDLEDAKNVAVLAPVCRRWRELTRYVESLRFTITTPSEMEPISGMLRRSHAIKRLAIAHESASILLTDEQLYEWINLASHSLQQLDLCLDTKSPVDLWEHLARCSSLRSVRVHGKIAIFFPILKTAMNSLRECILDDETSLKYPAVHTILAHCPALEKLVVTNFPTIKVKLFHSGLKSVTLHTGPQIDPESGPPFVLLEAASLEHLVLDGVSCVLYAPKLVELHLPSRCKDLIVVSLDNARLLTMGGTGWEFKEIHSVVELVPNISELRIEASVSDPEPVVWKTFFEGLKNLTTVSLGGNMLQCFCKEIDTEVLSNMKKLASVTIHLQEDCVALLSALLTSCSGLKLLVIDCSELLQAGECDPKLPVEELFEVRHPQLFSDLKQMQMKYPAIVQLKLQQL